MENKYEQNKKLEERESVEGCLVEDATFKVGSHKHLGRNELVSNQDEFYGRDHSKIK